MKLTTPSICQDWCCISNGSPKRQGLWDLPEEQLIRYLETNTRRDPWHAWLRVSIYIELSFRDGTFHNDYPYIVFEAVFGHMTPPPVNQFSNGIWYRRHHDPGQWPKSVQ